MSSTNPSTTGPAEIGEPDDFGAGSLFLADSRLAWLLLNHARYAILRRMFGVSRDQANLLTFVLALGGAETAYLTARRIVHTPLHAEDTDVGIAAFALREAAMSVAGPSARTVPGFAPLVVLGVAGGLALPGLRHAARNLRASEQRVRLRRGRRYSAARRAGADLS
jgi:hypothetical protein